MEFPESSGMEELPAEERRGLLVNLYLSLKSGGRTCRGRDGALQRVSPLLTQKTHPGHGHTGLLLEVQRFQKDFPDFQFSSASATNTHTSSRLCLANSSQIFGLRVRRCKKTPGKLPSFIFTEHYVRLWSLYST